MGWVDSPENRLAFVAGVEEMIAQAGGTEKLVESAVTAWKFVNASMHIDPATLERNELERAYTNAMHAAWHLARLSYAVNGSLLDGSDARRHNAAKGGEAKKKKNARAAAVVEAKSEARRLWPEASRKGWTAERLWTELSNRGHTVKADTVRKWLTQLRTTGTC